MTLLYSPITMSLSCSSEARAQLGHIGDLDMADVCDSASDPNISHLLQRESDSRIKSD